MRWLKNLTKKIFPMHITKRIYLMVVALIILPVVLTSFLIPFELRKNREAHRGQELLHIASSLEARLAQSYDEILEQNHALGKSPEEQARVLNLALQPIINEFNTYYPNTGLGYYSIALDRVVAVGPDFRIEDLQPLSHSFQSFQVYETGEPIVVHTEKSVFGEGKPILNAVVPIQRGGKIIGHAWANVKIEDIYDNMRDIVHEIGFIGLLFLTLSLFAAWRMFSWFTQGLAQFADALAHHTYNPGDKLLPELNPILDVVKKHTDDLLLAYAQLQEEVAVREAAERELKRSNRQITNILASISDAYLAIDPDGYIMELNKAAETLFGRTREELIGVDVFEERTIPHQVLRHYRTALQTLQAQHHEEYFEDDGRWLEVHAYPSKYGLFSYFHDVSDRKLMEAAARESEARFFKVFAASPSMMCLVRIEDWIVVEVNDTFLEIGGFNREEIIGNCSENLHFWSTNAERTQLRQMVVEKGSFRNFEAVFMTKQQQARTVLVSAERIDLAAGHCALVAMTDITERKHLEAEMIRLDRLSLLGEMAAGISHEVRNPLTTIRGFLQMLKIKPDCQSYNGYYDLMIEELDRANAIITEFLSIGRNKAVEQKVQNLNEIIEAIAPLIQADAVGQDKSLVLELEEIPDLLLNEKEIRQIILNLSRNALEAMAEGGILRIKTYCQQQELVLAVEDEGTGIPNELLDRLGTPFLTTKEHGTGLGLPVCYGIAARHKARITVSTSPKGTTFFVRFRLARL